MIVQKSYVDGIKIAIVGLAWLALAVLFYLGYTSTPLAGHIEWSVIASYAIVQMAMHFYSTLKKSAIAYL